MKGIVRGVLAGLILVAGSAVSAQDKPNIVLVFMDNFGWGEPGFNGGGIIRGAPKLRGSITLASEGLRLTNFNVEVQCTPSRSAIMTGRYAIRSGNGTVPLGEGVYGLVQWEVTMAEMLSEVGYATGMYGKWHLGRTKGASRRTRGSTSGMASPIRPTSPPIHLSRASPRAGLSEPYVLDAVKGSAPRKVRVYDLDYRPLIDRDLTDRAISFMKKSAAGRKPFFVYLPYTATHFPTHAPSGLQREVRKRDGGAISSCRSTATSASCSIRSMTWALRKTRSSSSRPTTVRNHSALMRRP